MKSLSDNPRWSLSEVSFAKPKLQFEQMVESSIPIAGLCRELCYQVVALESQVLVRLILAETIRLDSADIPPESPYI